MHKSDEILNAFHKIAPSGYVDRRTVGYILHLGQLEHAATFLTSDTPAKGYQIHLTLSTGRPVTFRPNTSLGAKADIVKINKSLENLEKLLVTHAGITTIESAVKAGFEIEQFLPFLTKMKSVFSDATVIAERSSKKPKGQPKKLAQKRLADTLASEFYRLTGELPTQNNTGGYSQTTANSFVNLVRDIFKILGIRDSADSMARAAIKDYDGSVLAYNSVSIEPFNPTKIAE